MPQQLTKYDDAAVKATAQAIEAVENLWREEIGTEAYQTMLDAMRRLGASSFPATR